jgi:TolA-binding protein
MRERPGAFDLDSTQDFYAEGRIEYARWLYDEGMTALKAKNLKAALTKLRTSARAFPFPTTLRQIGECLLQQGKPADATLYLAAAVGMSPRGKQVKPLLLLIKALLRARETAHALMRLQELADFYPEMTNALPANPEEAVDELLKTIDRQNPPLAS